MSDHRSRFESSMSIYGKNMMRYWNSLDMWSMYDNPIWVMEYLCTKTHLSNHERFDLAHFLLWNGMSPLNTYYLVLASSVSLVDGKWLIKTDGYDKAAHLQMKQILIQCKENKFFQNYGKKVWDINARALFSSKEARINWNAIIKGEDLLFLNVSQFNPSWEDQTDVKIVEKKPDFSDRSESEKKAIANQELRLDG